MKNIPLAPRSHVVCAGPLLIVDWPGLPAIVFDTCLLDRITARESDLILDIDDYEVAMYIADGPSFTERIAANLAPYTRQAVITRADVCEDAERRLRAATDATERSDSDFAVIVADASVVIAGERVSIGSSRFTIAEIAAEAADGGTLRLANGGRLQAAFVQLVAVAERRTGGREGYQRLEERVAAYRKRLS